MNTRGSVEFKFRLPIELKREERWFIASCPVLDVHSQGATEEEAKRNITDTLQLFIESCYERGTLEAVLKESGFTPTHDNVQLPNNGQIIDVSVPLLAA